MGQTAQSWQHEHNLLVALNNVHSHEKNSLYESWRDKLLMLVSEQLCAPCTDKSKENYKIDYDNPSNCGCRCEHVDKILANAKQIDEDIKISSKK